MGKSRVGTSGLKREREGSIAQGLLFGSLGCDYVYCLYNLSAEHLTGSHKYLRFNHCPNIPIHSEYTLE